MCPGVLKSSPSPLPHSSQQTVPGEHGPGQPSQLLLLAEQPEKLGLMEPEAVPKVTCSEADPDSRLGPAAS